MPTKRVEAFLAQVAGQVKWRAAHSGIRAELEDHIVEHTAELVAEGWSEEAAGEQAVAAMGDAREIGSTLDKLHRPQLGWGVLLLGLVLSALAMGHQIYAQRWGYHLPASTVAGLVLGLGMAAMLYFSDYSKWLKRSPALYGAAWLLAIWSWLFGTSVNGKRVYIHIMGLNGSVVLLMLLLFAASIAGLLYLWRQKGLAGLGACGALAALSLLPMMAMHRGSAFLLGLVYVVLFLLAIHWGYFGAKRRSLAVVLGAVALAAAAAVLYVLVNPYRVSRILDFVRPDNSGAGWIILRLRETLANAQLIGPASLSVTDAPSILTQDHTNYVFTRMISDWGLLAGLGIVLVMALLLGLGGYYLVRVHNRYGQLLSLVALALLGGQCALHILTNLGCFLPMDIQLPFFSAGGSNMLYSWLLLGVILSVWRRNHILTEAEPLEESGQQETEAGMISFHEGKLIIDLGAIGVRAKADRQVPQKE